MSELKRAFAKNDCSNQKSSAVMYSSIQLRS
jgi:hypothetical protein